MHVWATSELYTWPTTHAVAANEPHGVAPRSVRGCPRLVIRSFRIWQADAKRLRELSGTGRDTCKGLKGLTLSSIPEPGTAVCSLPRASLTGQTTVSRQMP
jgi:hypothetical protein